nr:pentatricopeptide repeat-containing protein At1g02370, mitochondrial-like [Ipomoea batatas]
MMKIVSNRISAGRLTVLRRLCTAVEAKAEAEATPAVQEGNQRLYQRLSALGATKGKASEILNEYIREGIVAAVGKHHLGRCIRELRKYGKHQCALEIMEWMVSRGVNFGPKDHAVHLDLIAKVQGISAAENYFNGLAPDAKVHKTYGALLNCYCVEKMVDKALEVFEKMDKMNYAITSLSFNNLMSLYMRLGQPEKVPPLAEEMKRRNIPLSTFTYNILMNSYTSLGDIEGVERVFEEIKSKNEKMCHWTTYSHLAIAYSKAGLNEKAELALKKLEEEIGPRDREGYHYLISLYAGLSNLGEVHRAWNSMKSQFQVTPNYSYLIVLQALSKLNDVDGLKKVFTEWELSCSSFDMRLANSVIGAYLRHDMISEAETVFRIGMERSKGPFFLAWEMFAVSFLKKKKIDRALQCFEAAVSRVQEHEWSPKPATIDAFLNYFEEERDVDGAEKFCSDLKKLNCLNSDVYKSLMQTYTAAGRISHDMRQRMEEDGIDMSDELENLLKKVCPE